MIQIKATELQKRLTHGEKFFLVDVREAFEHEVFNLGGELAPLSELFQHSDKFKNELPVVVYCKRGIRSQLAIQRLQQKFNLPNLINLQGGTEAWKKEVLNT